jgi:hypothetical protein
MAAAWLQPWSLPCFPRAAAIGSNVAPAPAQALRQLAQAPCGAAPLLPGCRQRRWRCSGAVPRAAPAGRFDDQPPKRKKQPYVKPKPKANDEPVVQPMRLAKVRLAAWSCRPGRRHPQQQQQRRWQTPPSTHTPPPRLRVPAQALAAAGVASRRACEELIAQGLVSVNGQVVRGTAPTTPCAARGLASTRSRRSLRNRSCSWGRTRRRAAAPRAQPPPPPPPPPAGQHAGQQRGPGARPGGGQRQAR